nr:chitinase [Sitophilus oryzae]
MGRKLVTLAFLSLTLQAIVATHIVCYHGTWSYYRTGNGNFKVTDVDPTLCTHYIYTFVGLNSSTYEVALLDEWLDISLSGFANAIALKETNSDLKVLVAVGGWNEGSAKYSVMAASATYRATFISSVITLLQTYGFDGFDLDWEYPARRDSTNSADKENFATLIKELKAAFDPYGYLLTAAVSAAPTYIDTSYDVPVLSEYLDLINLMEYDFFGAWDDTTGHNAPLYSKSIYDGTTYADYSVNASVYGWIERGASPSKLALGVPFYGRVFTLSSSSSTGVGAAVSGAGSSGPYTATAGFWGYNEILEQFAATSFTEAWDDEAQVPYAYSGTTWLSYDNVKSITLKVEYAKSLGLGGIMLWSLETDDIVATSGTKFQLLQAINSAVGNSSSSNSTSSTSTTSSTTSTTTASSVTSSTASTSTTTTSTTTTTAASTSGNTCTTTGYFRDSSDCSKYYYCQLVNGAYVATATLSCVSGLYYDTTTGVCNYASQVSCD